MVSITTRFQLGRTFFRRAAVELICVWLSVAAAADQPAKFDVPAMLEVAPIYNDCILDPADPHEQLIEIVLPISCWVEPKYRDSMQEFRFDVYWQRSLYPVVDYSPKTLLQSPVNGFVAVEKRADQTVKAGANSQLIGPPQTANVLLETTALRGTTERFEAIPQHDLLVASGSINRGTGVFFRFHAAKQFALEGGRELHLIYRVPKHWRGGLLRVDCLAWGKYKKFGGFSENIESKISFTVSTYAKGDRGAQEVAIRYVQSEQLLRQQWSDYIQHRPEPTLWQQVQTGFKKSTEPEPLPANWALQLIQSPVEWERAVKSSTPAELPVEIRGVVQQFADARRQLVGLGQ